MSGLGGSDLLETDIANCSIVVLLSEDLSMSMLFCSMKRKVSWTLSLMSLQFNCRMENAGVGARIGGISGSDWRRSRSYWQRWSDGDGGAGDDVILEMILWLELKFYTYNTAL